MPLLWLHACSHMSVSHCWGYTRALSHLASLSLALNSAPHDFTPSTYWLPCYPALDVSLCLSCPLQSCPLELIACHVPLSLLISVAVIETPQSSAPPGDLWPLRSLRSSKRVIRDSHHSAHTVWGPASTPQLLTRRPELFHLQLFVVWPRLIWRLSHTG